jgi:hypothetical protein
MNGTPYPAAVLATAGVLLAAFLVSGPVVGAAAADPAALEPDANETDHDIHMDTDLTARDTQEGASVGICMIGVSSPCNSEQYEDPSLKPADPPDNSSLSFDDDVDSPNNSTRAGANASSAETSVSNDSDPKTVGNTETAEVDNAEAKWEEDGRSDSDFDAPLESSDSSFETDFDVKDSEFDIAFPD